MYESKVKNEEESPEAQLIEFMEDIAEEDRKAISCLWAAREYRAVNISRDELASKLLEILKDEK